MSDLISRQAAIESVADEIWHYPNECYKNLNVFENAKDLAEHALRGLPSAQPEQRWIPCSERLPEEMGTYMVTVDYGKHRTATGQRYYYGRVLGWDDDCVIAWQPLPEPYKTDIRINFSKFSNFGLMDALREEFGYVKRSDCFGCEDETTEDNSTVPAHWIDQGHKIFKCSNCGNYLDFRGVNAGRGTANYCPNCGAKMDGKEPE